MASKPKDWRDEAETLDFDSIRERLEHYERLKEGKLAAKRKEALDQIREIMSGAELTVEDIAAEFNPRRATAGRKIVAKYRNPNNAKEEWSGQGRAPKWMPTDKNEWVGLLIK